jgi:endonuclease/exonuclease/phosphatase family metal-dependent hydrolase
VRFRWLWFVLLGCSKSAAPSAGAVDTSIEADTALDVEVPDVEAEVAIDSTIEVDSAIDADAAASDSYAPEADAEVAVDTAFPPPTWDPVCSSTDAGTDACTATRLRVMAANITSGPSLTYDAPGIRIFQGLKPDVVLVQEFKYPSGLRALVDTAFGTGFSFVVETDVGTIPNGIISRYPILESGEWDDPDTTDRDFVWARIDIPGPTDLYAVSVHFRTTSATARDTEAKLIVDLVKTKVPSGAFLVIGGDLNTSVETETALTVLSAVVRTSAPYAVDQAGNNKTNAPRNRPYDWVLPSDALFARMIPVRIGTSDFASGLVVDTRVYTPIADLSPALATDSAATNMQHMAVVRDFAVGD